MAVEASRPILTASSSTQEESKPIDVPIVPENPPAPPASTDQTGFQESLGLLHQIEWTAAALGLVLSVGSWMVAVPVALRVAVVVGAVFASLNFRLLIWSWEWIFHPTESTQTPGRKTRGRVVPRFLLKYLFLLAGLSLLVGGLKLHVLGFMVGMGNVLLAVALSPLMMQPSKT